MKWLIGRLGWLFESAFSHSPDRVKNTIGWLVLSAMIFGGSFAFHFVSNRNLSSLDLDIGFAELGKRDDIVSRLRACVAIPGESVGFAELCRDPFWKDVFLTIAWLCGSSENSTQSVDKCEMLQFLPAVRDVCAARKTQVPLELVLLASNMVDK